MIKNLIVLICIILIACTTPKIIQNKDTNDGIFNSTVALVYSQSLHVKCGAVAIGPNTLITAAHCVDQAPINFYITYPSWQSIWEKQAAALLYVDKGNDLALLHSTYQLPAWSEIANYIPQNNDRICTVYHPAGIPFRWSCGFILDNDEMTKNNLGQKLNVMETSIIALTGASGSGLWDIDGNLIGICLAQDTISGHGLFAKPSDIYNLSKAAIYFKNKGIDVEF